MAATRGLLSPSLFVACLVVTVTCFVLPVFYSNTHDGTSTGVIVGPSVTSSSSTNNGQSRPKDDWINFITEGGRFAHRATPVSSTTCSNVDSSDDEQFPGTTRCSCCSNVNSCTYASDSDTGGIIGGSFACPAVAMPTELQRPIARPPKARVKIMTDGKPSFSNSCLRTGSTLPSLSVHWGPEDGESHPELVQLFEIPAEGEGIPVVPDTHAQVGEATWHPAKCRDKDMAQAKAWRDAWEIERLFNMGSDRPRQWPIVRYKGVTYRFDPYKDPTKLHIDVPGTLPLLNPDKTPSLVLAMMLLHLLVMIVSKCPCGRPTSSIQDLRLLLRLEPHMS